MKTCKSSLQEQCDSARRLAIISYQAALWHPRVVTQPENIYKAMASPPALASVAVPRSVSRIAIIPIVRVPSVPFAGIIRTIPPSCVSESPCARLARVVASLACGRSRTVRKSPRWRRRARCRSCWARRRGRRLAFARLRSWWNRRFRFQLQSLLQWLLRFQRFRGARLFLRCLWFPRFNEVGGGSVRIAIVAFGGTPITPRERTGCSAFIAVMRPASL